MVRIEFWAVSRTFGLPLIQIKQPDRRVVDVAITFTTSVLLAITFNAVNLQQSSAIPSRTTPSQAQDLPSTHAADLGPSPIQCQPFPVRDGVVVLTELLPPPAMTSTPTALVSVPEDLPPIANAQSISPALTPKQTCVGGDAEPAPFTQSDLPIIQPSVNPSAICRQEDAMMLICLPISFE